MNLLTKLIQRHAQSVKKKGGEGGHYSSFYMLYQEKLALLQNAVHQFNQGKEVLSKIYQKKSWLT